MLFMDSFSHYATAQRNLKYFSASADVSAAIGRRGAGGVTTGAAIAYLNAPLGANSGTIVVGGAWLCNTLLNGHVVSLVRSNQNQQIGVCSNANGGFDVYRANATNAGMTTPTYLAGYGTLLGTTRIGVIGLGTWNYIEVKLTLHDSNGGATIIVNGLTEPTTPDCSSGQDTTASGSGDAVYAMMGVASTGRICDLYILDTSGSVNNDFLGDVRVDAHFPIADSATHHAWTPSTGTDNFAMVAETVPNTTDYNATDTPHATDTFSVTDLIHTGATMKAVQMLAYHIKSDVGTGTAIATVVRSGGADYVGEDNYSSVTSYLYARTVYDENPSGPHAWDETDFNAAEFGYEKTV